MKPYTILSDIKRALTGANVRVKNIGSANSVSRQTEALGLSVMDSNEELQAEWDSQLKEMTYLIISGIFCFICSMFLMASVTNGRIVEQKNELSMLHWMGMHLSTLGRMFYWQMAVISMIGTVLGIVISYSIPSFVQLEQSGSSNFAMTIPPMVSISIGLFCVVMSLLPGVFSSRKAIRMITDNNSM